MANKIPKVAFSESSPVIGFGQVTDVLITELGYPLAELTKEYIESRIANDSDTAGAIRMLTVIGDKPAPESNEIEISHFRKIRSPKTHTINFRVDENNDQNYEFVRQLEEDGISEVLIWYRTNSGKLYGGLNGIEASINIDEVIPESGDELNVLQGTLTWKGNHPERIDDPLASEGDYIDSIPPTVVITPADGSTGVSADTSISFEFSEAIRKVGGEIIDDANVADVVSLVDGSSNPVAFTATILYNKKKIVITPDTDLAADNYTASVSGVEDYAGNALAAASSTFTV